MYDTSENESDSGLIAFDGNLAQSTTMVDVVQYYDRIDHPFDPAEEIETDDDSLEMDMDMADIETKINEEIVKRVKSYK